jgi:hypothetical protein
MFDQFLHAFQPALHVVFLASVPFAAVCIVIVLMLKETPLRRTTGRGAGMDAAESTAMVESAETAMTPQNAPSQSAPAESRVPAP